VIFPLSLLIASPTERSSNTFVKCNYVAHWKHDASKIKKLYFVFLGRCSRRSEFTHRLRTVAVAIRAAPGRRADQRPERLSSYVDATGRQSRDPDPSRLSLASEREVGYAT